MVAEMWHPFCAVCVYEWGRGQWCSCPVVTRGGDIQWEVSTEVCGSGGRGVKCVTHEIWAEKQRMGGKVDFPVQKCFRHSSARGLPPVCTGRLDLRSDVYDLEIVKVK